MGLSLNKRSCVLGAGVNGRSQLHGDEDVPACDFTIGNVMLEKEELNELLDDKYAHNALFNTRGKLCEPMFRQFNEFSLKHKYEKSYVTLWLDLAETVIKFADCKLARIRLSPQTGGMTELTLQVQCTADAESMAQIYTHQKRDCSVNIRFGKQEAPKQKAQPELPLGSVDKGEDGEDSAATH
jgi:hypothetical protein